MFWRAETLELKKHWKEAMVAAVVLIMVVTYLAIFVAPLPETSVKNANAILSSAEGSRITVVGFITDLNRSHHLIDVPNWISFSLADFSDYQRYMDAVSRNDTDGAWWTVPPILVSAKISSGWVPSPTAEISGTINNGTNVSVLGTIKRLASNSESVFGLDAQKITVGAAGSFGIMTAPVAQKIFYFHMPSAWASYLAFGVTLLASVVYLRTRNQKYDHWAHSSVEIGVVFATIAILTGPIWAKQEWGVYWRWDDTKLVTTFILWLVYIGYLSLRAAIAEPSTKARISAVYGILGFITVPMSFLSARVAPLLQSSHPEVIASSTGSLSVEAGLTVGIAVIAFTLLFITMLIKRVEIAESEEEIEELKRKIGGEE